MILENTESRENNRRIEKGKGREKEENAIPSFGDNDFKILKSLANSLQMAQEVESTT